MKQNIYCQKIGMIEFYFGLELIMSEDQALPSIIEWQLNVMRKWQEVDWGQAIITGVLLGTVSGFGKIFVNAGNALAGVPSNGFPASAAIHATGKLLSRASKLITAGLRFVLKLLTKPINF